MTNKMKLINRFLILMLLCVGIGFVTFSTNTQRVGAVQCCESCEGEPDPSDNCWFNCRFCDGGPSGDYDWGSTGSFCLYSGMCPQGQTCDWGSCQPSGGGLGASCNQNLPCPSGQFCYNGSCTTGNLPASCTSTLQCPFPTSCNNGTCS